ncbi:MAG: hypothetical protein AABY15_02025 [Nanoarchaeota archaeon]
MKYLLITLFSLALIFANAQTDTKKWYYQYPKGPKVDTLLKPYVDEFLLECKEAGVSTKRFYNLETITFSVLPGSITGVCIPSNHIVYIDAAAAKLFPNSLRVLIFHELGHCVLGLAHVPMEYGVAIMNPILDLENLDQYYDSWEIMLMILFSDIHPKIKEGDNCCPDIINDPCKRK